MVETMKKNRLFVLMLVFAMLAVLPLAGCGKQQNESEEPADAAAETEAQTEEGSVIDYMVLVSPESPLPDGWEGALETTTITNSVGDEVVVESKAYEAKLAIEAGATEVDMVLNDSMAKEHNYGYIEDEVRLVKKACGKIGSSSSAFFQL